MSIPGPAAPLRESLDWFSGNNSSKQTNSSRSIFLSRSFLTDRGRKGLNGNKDDDDIPDVFAGVRLAEVANEG